MTVCYGEVIPELTAIGNNLTWYKDHMLSLIVQTGPVYDPGIMEIGSYSYFVVQETEHCRSMPEEVVLTIYPLPVVDLGEDTAIFENQELYVTLEENYEEIVWYDGSTDDTLIISGSVLSPGSYEVSILVSNEFRCWNSDTMLVEIKEYTNIHDQSLPAGIMVYPNPSGDVINMRITGYSKNKIEIKIFDKAGRIVLSSKTYSQDLVKHLILDVSYLMKGLYILQIQGNNLIYKTKFIKQ